MKFQEIWGRYTTYLSLIQLNTVQFSKKNSPRSVQVYQYIVIDPRYAAKYGNPYLRGPGVPSDMPPTPRNMGSPQMNPRNYSFATLDQGYQQAPSSPNMQGFSTGHRPKKANVNYTGTMIGNGKVANNTKANGSGNQSTSQYIVSPETDAKSDAMATHV